MSSLQAAPVLAPEPSRTRGRDGTALSCSSNSVLIFSWSCLASVLTFSVGSLGVSVQYVLETYVFILETKFSRKI